MNKLTSLVTNDSGFAFDPMTGESYTVNETGRIVIDQLAAGAAVPKIAEKVAAKFAVSFEDAFADVLEFRGMLRIYGLEG
jgi:hypothetical protein